MTILFRAARQADSLCGRLNPGMLAFAGCLALIDLAMWSVHHPEIYLYEFAETAAATGETIDCPMEAGCPKPQQQTL